MKMGYLEDWPEIIAFILLIIGAFVGLGSSSAVISYTLIFLVGLMGGRTWYRIKLNFKIAWSIILVGFLIGFIIGSRYGDGRVIVLFYISGIILSYYLHDKGIIKSLEY